MRFWITVMIVVAGLWTQSSAQAAFMTGRVLLSLCASDKADDQFGCENYIAGVIDYHSLVRSLGTVPSVDFCLPSGTRMQQIKQIVQQQLQSRPEQQSFVAAPAVALALYGAYPCRKSQK